MSSRPLLMTAASAWGNVPNLLKRLLRSYKIGVSAYRINKFGTLPGVVKELSVRCVVGDVF